MNILSTIAFLVNSFMIKFNHEDTLSTLMAQISEERRVNELMVVIIAPQ